MRAYSNNAHFAAKKIPKDQDGQIKEEDASYEASRRKYRKKKRTFSNRQNYGTIRSAAAPLPVLTKKQGPIGDFPDSKKE
jgi:hypothetical protein